jgi:hypothetical protein
MTLLGNNKTAWLLYHGAPAGCELCVLQNKQGSPLVPPEHPGHDPDIREREDQAVPVPIQCQHTWPQLGDCQRKGDQAYLDNCEIHDCEISDLRLRPFEKTHNVLLFFRARMTGI